MAVVLITGCSSGIGEALARAYAAPGVLLALTGRDEARLVRVAEACAKAGARVVVAARNVEKSRGAVKQLKALGSDAFAITVDVANEQSVKAMIDETVSRCSRLDILINNAGANKRGDFFALTDADWEAGFRSEEHTSELQSPYVSRMPSSA